MRRKKVQGAWVWREKRSRFRYQI